MSKQIKQGKLPTPIDEFLAWMESKNFGMKIVAVGKKTGQIAAAEDFWEVATHNLDVIVFNKSRLTESVAENGADSTSTS